MVRKINPEVDKIVQKYKSLPLLYQAIGHLFSVGHSTFENVTDAEMLESEAEIKTKEQQYISSGKFPLMTADYQIELMRYSRDLSKIELWDILYYIKKILPIS